MKNLETTGRNNRRPVGNNPKLGLVGDCANLWKTNNAICRKSFEKKDEVQ
jgi:hypothetical protein